MRRQGHLHTRWQHDRTWAAAPVTGLVVALVAVNPTPLLPLARGYRALCEQYPPLALLTFHAPPLPLALLLSLFGLALIAGVWAGSTRLIRTVRFNRRLQHGGRALPPQLARIGSNLGIADQLTYLEWAEPAACCYGFIQPRVAVTAGLVTRLDDEELIAVLAHERRHLRRRDPLRLLAVHALTATAFMFPVAPSLRRRLETWIELDADRAAWTVASRGALAGALLVVLTGPQVPVPGAVGLTATEARIAQLSGRALVPEISTRSVVASLSLAAVILLTTVDLTLAPDLVRMRCPLCPGVA